MNNVYYCGELISAALFSMANNCNQSIRLFRWEFMCVYVQEEMDGMLNAERADCFVYYRIEESFRFLRERKATIPIFDTNSLDVERNFFGNKKPLRYRCFCMCFLSRLVGTIHTFTNRVLGSFVGICFLPSCLVS